MLTLATWLDADPVRLSTVLEHRADVAAVARGRDVVEIARRLEHPDSLVRVAQWLTTPHFEVLEATLALGDGATVSSLAELLADSGTDHNAHVRFIVGELVDVAFMWPDPSGRLYVASGAEEMWPYPLGLGRRARTLLAETGMTQLRSLAKAHDLRPLPPSRAELVDVVASLLADRGRVRQSLAEAPTGFAEDILRWAEELVGFTRGGSPTPADLLGESVPELERQSRWVRRSEALAWAAERGLLLGYHSGREMPVEVVLALARSGVRAPFSPTPPTVVVQPTEAARVQAASAGAATELHQQALNILDVLPRLAVSPAASGGIGIRDLTRLAKHVGTSTAVARLTLELAMASGLLELRWQGVEHSPTFERWRGAEPAHRYAVLVWGWWHLPFAPTQDRDADGRAIRPCSRWIGNLQGDLARHAVVTGFHDVPAGTGADRDSYLTSLLWQRPALAKFYGANSNAWARAWDEAELLGVIALGCVTELGLALSDGPPADLEPVLRPLLPTPTASATFGADLRVTVLGPPTAALSQLLDACADRESASAASTWRFSAPSVRRALDAGVPAEQLLGDLAAVSEDPLPQPLRYLIGDVHRRYGEMTVVDASCVLTVGDPHRLAEVLADKRLSSLGLVQLDAATLGSARAAPETLALLRKHGYFPASRSDGRPATASRSVASSGAGSASRRRR